MELIRGVDLDPYKARIVANLLDVARALGIDTLAEGIETDGEREWVAAHGATYLQGFLIARPSASPRSGPSAGTAPGQTTRRALPAITTP
jgi:EAL domain-containing protein (putative c-di-GMP-specific phosphodiesterase class I)